MWSVLPLISFSRGGTLRGGVKISVSGERREFNFILHGEMRELFFSMPLISYFVNVIFTPYIITKVRVMYGAIYANIADNVRLIRLTIYGSLL